MNEQEEEKILNDYHRIALSIGEQVQTIWSLKSLNQRIKIGEHEQMLVVPVLQTVIKELTRLQGWVEGLADSHGFQPPEIRKLVDEELAKQSK